MKLFIVAMLAIPFIVLMVVNAYRVFRIWIWIILSPFIVLDIAFNGPLQNSGQGENFKIGPML